MPPAPTAAFHYSSDPAGDVLAYTFTISGQTTICYTYEKANQLLTTNQNGVTWHYTYVDKGNLVESTPAVETYTRAWQPQAELPEDEAI